jgi:hypothetical protein
VKLFNDNKFKIFRKKADNIENIVDGLNIYAEQYLFSRKEQLAALYFDRKLDYEATAKEDGKMGGLSFANFD